jgi:hypothetical protein
MVINIRGYDVLIDSEDYGKIIGYNWRPFRGKNSSKDKTYFHAELYGENRETIHLHRLIMACIMGDGKFVDHSSGDTLDCRKENLRVCSKTENNMNRGKQSNNTSGFKGVFWHNSAKKWMVQIRGNNKLKYIGLFPTAEQAAIEYNKAAIKYHGEFARLNQIEAY